VAIEKPFGFTIHLTKENLVNKSESQNPSVFVLKKKINGIKLILDAKTSVSQVISSRGGRATAAHIDVLHTNPSLKGKGTPKITWETNLQWWDGPGLDQWVRVVTIKNHSSSEQHVELLVTFL
jgi:hypothetical protein